MEKLWPTNIEPLPLKEKPDGKYVVFKGLKYGKVGAAIYDERGFVIDIITEHSFLEAYNRVAEEYPTAKWRPNESRVV